MRSDEWFTLAELNDRLGSLVWIEEQLGEVLASWSKIEGTAAVAVLFATTGRHHQWHSDVIRGCLPTSPKLQERDPVRAPTVGWSNAIVTLGALDAPNATSARLKALARVIDPWLQRETNALQELSRPVSDAAMSRWLRFVTTDHDHDGQVASAMLAARSTDAVRFDDHLAVAELKL